MTVAVPSDSNKQKAESQDGTSSQTIQRNKRSFRGIGQENKKQQ